MANLGSDDTPIAGESFGLPSGWALTENAAGEVVIEDSGANVVFRRDETAGEWVTDSIDANQVTTERLDINHETVFESGRGIPAGAFGITLEPDETSSTSFTEVADMGGAIDTTRIPDGTALYGNFTVRTGSLSSGETATIVPRVHTVPEASYNLTELETTTNDETGGQVTTGWTELTSLDDGLTLGNTLQAQVSGGTVDFSGPLAAVALEWRFTNG